MRPTLEETLRRVRAMHGTKLLDAAGQVTPGDAHHHWGNIVEALEMLIEHRWKAAQEEREMKIRTLEKIMELTQKYDLRMSAPPNPTTLKPEELLKWVSDLDQKSAPDQSAQYQRSKVASSQSLSGTKSDGTSTSSTNKE